MAITKNLHGLKHSYAFLHPFSPENSIFAGDTLLVLLQVLLREIIAQNSITHISQYVSDDSIYRMNTTPENAINSQGLTYRFANGDKAAFETLYDQYAPIVFGIMLQLTENKKLAENLLSDCFVAVWQSKNLYKPENSFLGWMLGIMRPIVCLTLQQPDSTISNSLRNVLIKQKVQL